MYIWNEGAFLRTARLLTHFFKCPLPQLHRQFIKVILLRSYFMRAKKSFSSFSQDHRNPGRVPVVRGKKGFCPWQRGRTSRPRFEGLDGEIERWKTEGKGEKKGKKNPSKDWVLVRVEHSPDSGWGNMHSFNQAWTAMVTRQATFQMCTCGKTGTIVNQSES